MKWNKLTTRKLTEDEVEIYGDKYDFMWEGTLPDIGEEVLVTYPTLCLLEILWMHTLTRG